MLARSLSPAPLLALLLAGSLAYAQPSEPRSVEPLTLQRTVELALTRNEVPRIASARIDRARALTREAWARLLPQAMLQGTYTRRPNEVTRTVGDATVVVQSRNGLAATGSAEATLLDAPGIALVLRAPHAEKAERMDAETLVRDLTFEAASAWFAVRSAEELLAAAERRVAAESEALNAARKRLEAGVAGRQDVTRTELALSSAKVTATDARLLADTTRLALAQLLALPVDRVELASGEGLELEAGAPAERPELLALEARVRAAELLAVEPWLRLVPSLGVGASFRATNEPGISGQIANWSLFGTATWQLYDGGLRYAQADARRAEAEQLKLELEALRRAVGREQDEASLRIAAAAAALEEAQTTKRVAAENAEQIERLFSAGLATALERVDANAAAYAAEAELARQSFALQVARLEQRRARGLWPVDGLQVPQERR